MASPYKHASLTVILGQFIASKKSLQTGCMLVAKIKGFCLPATVYKCGAGRVPQPDWLLPAA